MIRAYFLKPETKRKNNIAESLFEGLAMCVKEINEEQISGRRTIIKVGDVMPYFKTELGHTIKVKLNDEVKDGVFNDRNFNFDEYFAIGTNKEEPTPETIPKGIAYCFKENPSEDFKRKYTVGNFYHIYKKLSSKPERYAIFNDNDKDCRCTRDQFLDSFIIPIENNESEIDKQTKELAQENKSSEACKDFEGGIGDIEITIPEDLEIPEELKPAPKGDLYECVKWDGEYFIGAKLYENQPQELTLKELELGYACFISEQNKVMKFSPIDLKHYFKLAI